MNGPKRFLASGGLKADLLASARTDRPSQGSRRRALVAAGAAAAATSSAGMALGSSVGGTVVRWAVWKWVAVGLASTAVVVTARTVLTPAPDVDTRTVVAQSDVSRVTPGAKTKLSVNEGSLTGSLAKPEEAPPAPGSSPASVEVVAAPKKIVRTFAPALSTNPKPEKVEAVAAPAPAPPASSQLATEIATLDQAKHAVKSGDATRALHILDSYDATFAHGALAPEASALRIEALARAGRHTEARSELGAFRASHPESPLLGVLSGIVGEGS